MQPEIKNQTNNQTKTNQKQMKKIFTLLAAIMMIAGSISVNAEVKVKLTQAMFKQWYSETTGELLATPKSTGCDFNVGSSTDMVYGNRSVKWYTYADLSKYKTLVLEVAAGTPCKYQDHYA